MTESLSLALQIAAIGLPVMIAIICVFILLAKLLVAIFPHERPKPAADMRGINPGTALNQGTVRSNQASSG
ncbi:MAG: hypothetical protein KGZ75_15540 [Syntrophomonadaceae bacterium]|nr:hypothetical protein [Syntrophomonadaceae bacterium]